MEKKLFHFLIAIGALMHRKKFECFRSSSLKIQGAEVALFRVWLVVMSI